MMGTLRWLMTGHHIKETAEQRVRRLANNRSNGYIQPVVPALVDLYDRIAELETRVEELSRRV